MTTVLLEGCGEVPCEAVGERWHTVTVSADYAETGASVEEALSAVIAKEVCR